MPKLDTGEEIFVILEPDGKNYRASVVVPGLATQADHHAIGRTKSEAVNRLKEYVRELRRGLKEDLVRVPGELHKISYSPGDVFVLTVKGPLTEAANERLQAKWRANFPDTRLIVLGTGVSMQILSSESAAYRDQVEDMRKRKDRAYKERSQLVALLAALFPATQSKTNIEGWDPEWHNCVYVLLPTGQVSWHYHDSHAELFEHVPRGPGFWDGHTTEQKYDRIRAAIELKQMMGGPKE